MWRFPNFGVSQTSAFPTPPSQFVSSFVPPWSFTQGEEQPEHESIQNIPQILRERSISGDGAEEGYGQYFQVARDGVKLGFCQENFIEKVTHRETRWVVVRGEGQNTCRGSKGTNFWL